MVLRLFPYLHSFSVLSIGFLAFLNLNQSFTVKKKSIDGIFRINSPYEPAGRNL